MIRAPKTFLCKNFRTPLTPFSTPLTPPSVFSIMQIFLGLPLVNPLEFMVEKRDTISHAIHMCAISSVSSVLACIWIQHITYVSTLCNWFPT